jgi:D-amino-acid dehydrogenase
MRVLVVGSGLIGLTTAHYLAQGGAAVTVLDAAGGPATGASHANGGLLTPSMSEPWNSPGVFWSLLRWLGRAEAPLLIRPRALPQYARWMTRFVGASTPARFRANTLSNLRLGLSSVQLQQRLRRELKLEYDAGTRGTLKLFRDPRQLEVAHGASVTAAQHGLESRRLDAAATVALEPALAPIERSLAGSLHFPGDETGDARSFCERLAESLAARGVAFHYGLQVKGWDARDSRIAAVRTTSGTLDADAYVVAAGAHSADVVKPLGLSLPIQPVKGYSLSIPLRDWSPVPGIGIVDDALHAAATPIGRVLRVAGTAEFSGFDRTVHDARVENLRRLVDAVYPAASHAARGPAAIAWAGLRPMSPDGVPVIGRSPLANLYVNAGHGHLGWTLAAGSGSLLADILLGNPGAVDERDYSWRRFL